MPADAEFPDAIVVPGFVDMHVHGGGGASFADGNAADIARAAEFHLRHGTTTTLASLVTAGPAELLSAVGALAEATRDGVVAGIHLEGPWLSPARCGAHDHTRMRAPDPAEIESVLAAADGAVRMVTLAPELPGSDAAIRRFRDAEVVVAVGHTDATYTQTRHAIDLGATVGTHLFNAMPPLDHRAPGPVLALLCDPRVTVEIIADGVHVHPAVVHAVIEAVGPDRVAVVTDAIAAAGCGDGAFRLGTMPIEVESSGTGGWCVDAGGQHHHHGSALPDGGWARLEVGLSRRCGAGRRGAGDLGDAGPRSRAHRGGPAGGGLCRQSCCAGP